MSRIRLRSIRATTKKIDVDESVIVEWGAAKGVPIEGLAFELKHLNKHLEGTDQAIRLINKAR